MGEHPMFNSFFLAPVFSVEQQWQAKSPQAPVAAPVVGQPFLHGLELFSFVIKPDQ